MLTQNIQNLINELFEATPDYVGVGLGYKQKNKSTTDQEAIIFFVTKKKPLSELNPNEILPSLDIEIDGRLLKTDVVEVGEIVPLACEAPCYSWQAVPPPNRGFIRPLKGGISITSKTKIGSVGTLGFIAVDTTTQALVGVTNNHVVIRDAFYSNQRTLNNIIQNEYDINDGGLYEPDIVYQHGEWPAGSTPPSNFQIGNVIRYVPIYKQSDPGVNKVDGALVSVECSPVIDFNESFKQFNLPYNLPIPFATTAEINSLLSTNPSLYSSGRTTGAKGNPTCPLRTLSIGTNITVGGCGNVPPSGYFSQGGCNFVNFSDVICFVRPENDPNLAIVCSEPIAGGDSGSGLIADFNGTWKLIGLVFAGSQFFGYANRIDHVAAELGIEAWMGDPKPLVDNSTINFVTVNGLNNIKKVTCNGQSFWQVGTTSQVNTCSGTITFGLGLILTPGSVDIEYTLTASSPVPEDCTLTFNNILETYSGKSITISPSITILSGATTGQTMITVSENYDNLTTQVFFNDFDLVVTPGNEFPFTVTENVSFPLPSVTPNITPTPTPTIPVPIL
jgi:hypothetical protein